MLLIFYALEVEIRPFRRRLHRLRRWAAEGCNGWQGSLGDTEITLVETGVGIQRAASSARRALELMGSARSVISTGVAGALSEELAVGTIVVADRLLCPSPDSNTEFTVIVPERGCAQSLAQVLTGVGLSVAVGPTLTVPAALSDGLSKRAAHARSGAIAVDMESAAIAGEAQARGVNFVYARSVLDAVDDRLPPSRLLDENGNIRPAATAAFLLRRPAMFFKWAPRIARNLGVATIRLAEALETLARRPT